MFNFFNKTPKTIDPNLSILIEALNETPRFVWWAELLPDKFVIELDNTLLHFSYGDNKTSPNSKIAIHFIKPSSVTFLSSVRNDIGNKKWYELLHEDKLETPFVNFEGIAFNDKVLFQKILEENIEVDNVFGCEPLTKDFYAANIQFGFRAGPYCFLVSCESIELRNYSGKFELSDVEFYFKKWWDYWNRYWESKKTLNPYPINYTAETMIPLLPGEFDKLKGKN